LSFFLIPSDSLELCVAADMTFTHEGNKTYFDGLVNFEKMVSTSENVPLH